VNRKIVIRVAAYIVVGVLTAGIWIQSGELDLGWIRYLSAAVFTATVFISVWDLWLWRIPLVQRIPNVPRNIRGTWKGELQSLWFDPTTGSRPIPKSVYIAIRQTSSIISVRLFTDESQSHSSLADLTVNDGIAVLEYMYLNRPKIHLEDRSRMHHGSTVLQVTGNPAKRLEGRYWTDRDTRGSLQFNKRVHKVADDYLNAQEIHDQDEMKKRKKPPKK
jgi:hypothetical protein